MSASTKSLMRTVMDDYHPAAQVLYQITHYKTCDAILRWLILSKITGKNFVQFLQIEHKNSVLNMVKFIIMKQTKAKQIEEIIKGKDWT